MQHIANFDPERKLAAAALLRAVLDLDLSRTKELAGVDARQARADSIRFFRNPPAHFEVLAHLIGTGGEQLCRKALQIAREHRAKAARKPTGAQRRRSDIGAERRASQSPCLA